MDTKGKHLLCDIWLDESVSDELVKKITDVIDTNLTVMNRSSYKFEPEGLTVAYILAESHFTMHTYPESNYLSVDIYICSNDFDLDLLLVKMLDGLKVRKLTKKLVIRGIEQE
jgi:S-adenosylmethionine decarboxylase